MFKHADKTSDTARTRVRIAVQTNDIFRAVNIAADKRKRFRVARRGRFDKIADRTSFSLFSAEFSVCGLCSSAHAGKELFAVFFAEFVNGSGQHGKNARIGGIFC